MQAIVMNQFGGPEVLEARRMPIPKPGLGQILVEIYATGLNPIDFKLRSGVYKDIFPTPFPNILGGDISGIVHALGAGATDFAIGDEVYFSNPLGLNGGYAQYAVVDQAIVAHKPTGLSHLEAATLPVAGLTSIQALRDFSGLKAGQKILIHGGAGGVGSFAIQYAKAIGAKVFTTATSAKHEYVYGLGADRAIDYTKENFVEVAAQEGGMDVVLETIGGANYIKSLQATRAGGAVPCIVNAPDVDSRAFAIEKKIKTDFFLLQNVRNDLEEISRLVTKGAIRPIATNLVNFDGLIDAHRQLEAGRVQGKLVLSVR